MRKSFYYFWQVDPGETVRNVKNIQYLRLRQSRESGRNNMEQWWATMAANMNNVTMMKKDPPSNYPREVVQSLCRLIWETHRVLLQKGPSIPSFKKITCYTWFSQPWLEVRKNECYKKQTQRRYKVQNQLQHKLMLELDCHFVAQNLPPNTIL